MAAALARPSDCVPLDEPGLRDLVVQLRSGVDRGDEALVGQMALEIDDRLPCLTFPPAPHTWAELLVLRAVTAYATDGEWESPMAAALRVYPGVDRVVSSRHPLASWEPPVLDAAQGPLPPPGVRVYVDGLPSATFPPRNQVALVQRTDGRWWNTVVVDADHALPSDWLEDAVVPPPHVGYSATLSAGYSWGTPWQDPQFRSDWVLPVTPGEQPLHGLTVRAQAGVALERPVAFLADASTTLTNRSPGTAALGAVAWNPGTAAVGVGVAVASVDVVQGPPDSRRGTQERLWLPGGAAVARVATSGRFRWGLGGDLTWGPAVVRVAADVGLGLPPGRNGRWVVGFGFADTSATLEQQGPGAPRALKVGSRRLVASVGRSFGEDL
jgi:hypothetical protein